ncbi:MAG TPA: pyridoxal-phosphate dependent enzyme [Pseudonocardiaceae bacterium]|jgi:cysteine synthase A
MRGGRWRKRWGAHFLDHFTDAEPAVAAWPPTIADELFAQLTEPPQWIVVGAGTGATSAALGRHIRTAGLDTKLAVVDPENSAYFSAWASGAADYGTGMPSRAQATAFTNVVRSDTGAASTLFNALRQLGSALGVAAITITLTLVGGQHGDRYPYHVAFLVAALIAISLPRDGS